ncbi:hypothetical protein E1B28_002946 [Marasmius oreades]|uniref:Uncharacterized protein n=1 Tax=Marasmius oreades TaxID=181124 RepID=A0A9P7UIW3_9AGAR|nr:uncharacterized protein E1B28_002946 [Marasmius oreades]KAG7085382.1 hypothetical protein E1B28_002946 [Marasmius oreades]
MVCVLVVVACQVSHRDLGIGLAFHRSPSAPTKTIEEDEKIQEASRNIDVTVMVKVTPEYHQKRNVRSSDWLSDTSRLESWIAQDLQVLTWEEFTQCSGESCTGTVGLLPLHHQRPRTRFYFPPTSRCRCMHYTSDLILAPAAVGG